MAKPSVSASNVGTPAGNEDDESMSNDVPSTMLKAARGKKRKNPETTTKERRATGRTQAKRARGTRGILKELVEMPLDVLFEIFGCLEPLDLLHLSWTSKALRALLMTRSSVSVWKQTFHNLPSPTPPKCPDDLNEPQYTELLFRKSCSFCNRTLATIHVSWAARVRSCTKCLDLHLHEYAYGSKPYGWELYGLLPKIQLKKKYGPHKRGTQFIFPEIDQAWIDMYESIDSTAAKQHWLEATIEQQKVIEEHANRCADWYSSMQSRLEGEKERVLDENKLIIREHLKHLGWGEELDLLPLWAERPENIPVVEKACRKEITDSVLDGLEEPLNLFMEEVKAKRLVRIRSGIVKTRLSDVNKIREAWVKEFPAKSIYPTIGELMRLPFVRNIIDGLADDENFTEAHLEAIRLDLDDLNTDWQEGIKKQLIEIVSQSSEDAIDHQTALNLATTSFLCANCYLPRFLRYPDVIMHKCTTDLDWPVDWEADLETKLLRQFYSEALWNAKRIIIKPENITFLKLLIRLAGLNPKTATLDDMDALDPIFECISCNDFTKGRATMTWKTALVHRFHPYESHAHPESLNKFTPILLEDSEATTIRSRMKEENERSLWTARNDSMICTHCKKTGTYRELWKHVRENHSTANPTDEDIVLTIDSKDAIPPVYRHWPPRPAGEVGDV